jgi:uncharacterized protein YukE
MTLYEEWEQAMRELRRALAHLRNIISAELRNYWRWLTRKDHP